MSYNDFKSNLKNNNTGNNATSGYRPLNNTKPAPVMKNQTIQPAGFSQYNPTPKSPVIPFQNNTDPFQMNTKLTLQKLYFTPVPKEHPMHYRPMEVTGNEMVIKNLEEVTRGGTLIDHSALRRVASSIIHHSHQSRGSIDIANGWDTERYAFYALIEVETPIVRSLEVISGYTSHLGYTETQGPNSGSFDDSMLLFISSSMSVRSQRMISNSGQTILGYAPSNINTVLSPIQITQGNTSIRTDAAIGLRPTDALHKLSVNSFMDQSATGKPLTFYDPGIYIPGASASAGNYYGTASSRSNECPSRYLSKVLQAYRNTLGASSGESFRGMDDSLILGNAASYALEKELGSSPLFLTLSQETLYGSTGALTFAQFHRLFPNALMDDVTTVIAPTKGTVTDTRSICNHNGGSDYETQVAYSLGHLVPSILSDTMGVQVVFDMTNKTFDGRHECTIMKFDPMFTCLNSAVHAENFKLALENDVAVELFGATQVPYSIHMEVQLFARGFATIQIGDGNVVPVSIPNYPTGIASSMVATEQNQLDQMANASNELIDHVFTNVDKFSNTSYQSIGESTCQNQ